MQGNVQMGESDPHFRHTQLPIQNTQLSPHGQDHINVNKPLNLCRLFVVVSLISLSSFYFGFSLTYLQAIPIKLLKAHYGNILQYPIVMPILTGAMPVGAIFGSLLAEVGIRNFTRRNYLAYLNMLALGVNIVIQYTNVWVLLVCRLLIGIFVGLYLAIVPIYIHQITPHSASGVFGTFTQMQKLLGTVVSYLFGIIFYRTKTQSQFSMRFQMGFTSILIILQMIFILAGYITESPNSLIKFNKLDEARRVIGLFNHESKIDEIIHQKIQQNNSQSVPAPFHHQHQSHQSQSQKMEGINKNNQPLIANNEQVQMTWKSYLLGFQLPFTHQLTGVNFLVTQLTAITVVYDQKMSRYTACMANSVQFIFTLLSAALIYRFGRRTLILSGNFIIGILNICIGLTFLALDRYGWLQGFPLSMGLIVVFNMVFGLTLGPIVWLYIPQIVTQKVVPMATATYWCGCSICVIFAPIVASQMNSPFGVFIFLGIYLLFVFVLNYFLVIQTKGLSAVEITQKFKQL